MFRKVNFFIVTMFFLVVSGGVWAGENEKILRLTEAKEHNLLENRQILSGGSINAPVRKPPMDDYVSGVIVVGVKTDSASISVRNKVAKKRESLNIVKSMESLRVPNSPPKSAKQPYKNPRIC